MPRSPRPNLLPSVSSCSTVPYDPFDARPFDVGQAFEIMVQRIRQVEANITDLREQHQDVIPENAIVARPPHTNLLQQVDALTDSIAEIRQILQMHGDPYRALWLHSPNGQAWRLAIADDGMIGAVTDSHEVEGDGIVGVEAEVRRVIDAEVRRVLFRYRDGLLAPEDIESIVELIHTLYSHRSSNQPVPEEEEV